MTSATASSIRSAGWVESSAAMISESDVERNVTPCGAQLGVELDRVDQVAVVGERDLAPVGAPDGLRVLPRVRAGRRVADVPDGQVAVQRAQLLLVEDLVDEPLVAHGHDVAALRDGDARRLLPAVLQGIEGEIGEAGDIGAWGADAEDAALVARSVAELEHGKAQDSGAPGENCPDGCPSGVDFSRTDRRGSARRPTPPPGGIRCHEQHARSSSPSCPRRARHGRRERTRLRSGPPSRAAPPRRSRRSSTSPPPGSGSPPRTVGLHAPARGTFARKLGPTGLALNDIEFQAGGNVGLAVGAGGQVYRSTDAGAPGAPTWAGRPRLQRRTRRSSTAASSSRSATSTPSASPATRARWLFAEGSQLARSSRHGRHGRQLGHLGRRELAGQRHPGRADEDCKVHTSYGDGYADGFFIPANPDVGYIVGAWFSEVFRTADNLAGAAAMLTGDAGNGVSPFRRRRRRPGEPGPDVVRLPGGPRHLRHRLYRGRLTSPTATFTVANRQPPRSFASPTTSTTPAGPSSRPATRAWS